MPNLYDIDGRIAVIIDPESEFNGWLCRRQEDGQYVAERPLAAIDAEALMFYITPSQVALAAH